MSRRRNRIDGGQITPFEESVVGNCTGFQYYYTRLKELALSRFQYENLPDTMDARYLELCLFTEGQAVLFQDEIMGALSLRVMTAAPLSVYNIPTRRTAYASNGYRAKLDASNSTLMYNTLAHNPDAPWVMRFAKRLWDLDEAIDVNAKAQKTPILITAEQNERLSLLNLYKDYEGNAPVIHGTKGLNAAALSVLKTDAPFNALGLYELKNNIWNEALCYLGILNVTDTKKSNQMNTEVSARLGGALNSRYSPLEARRQALDDFNRKFGYDITVSFRDYELISQLAMLYGNIALGDEGEEEIQKIKQEEIAGNE